MSEGMYPFYVRSQKVETKNDFEFDEEAIIIPGEGGIGEVFHYANGKYALHQRAYRIHFLSDKIYTKFAFYYFKAHFKEFILGEAVSATVTSIRKPMIENFPIPVPTSEKQKEIIKTLNEFEDLTTNITQGLPAEIEVRQQQYEYYRNRLLTFKRKGE